MSSLVKPFKAFYYNPQKLRGFSSLICPPYDLIGEKEKEYFNQKSPYNFSHILIVDKNHNYKTLAHRFHSWIKKGIFIQDPFPCFYLYEQKFSYQGENFQRVGFLGLLKLDKKGVIFPHENTLKEPKEDRFYMLKETRANLSPIFVVCDKKLSALRKIYSFYSQGKPFIEFRDFQGIYNRIWRIEKEKFISNLTGEVNKCKFFIADGHHRFEVAYRYFRINKNKLKDSKYILAYFTDPSPGLIILPTHRIVELEVDSCQVIERLSPYFLIKKLKNEKELKEILYSRGNGLSFGLYKRRKYYFLELKNKQLLDKIFKNKKEKQVYKKLDVCMLHEFVFKQLPIKSIEYVHSSKEIKKVANNQKIGFILREPQVDKIFSIAKQGCLLPQKSTYFFPKVPSGLLLRRLEN